MSTITRNAWKAQQPSPNARVELGKVADNDEALQTLQDAGMSVDSLRALDRNGDAKLDLGEAWRAADHFDHNGDAGSLVDFDPAGQQTEASKTLNTLGLLLQNRGVTSEPSTSSTNDAGATAAPTGTSTNAAASSQASAKPYQLNSEGKLQLGEAFLDSIQASQGLPARQRFELWQNMINSSVGKSDTEKLRNVEGFFNLQIKYTSDRDNQGVRDYWQDPIESLKSGKGDCEDYAVAKYASLRMLGFAADKLGIAYVQQTTGGAHAVLLAERDDYDTPVLLDNLTHQGIALPQHRPQYRPVFLVNETDMQVVDSDWNRTGQRFQLPNKISDVFARTAPLLPAQ